MPTAATDNIKRNATSKVLCNMGDGAKELIEHHLRRHGVSLDVRDTSKFSLDQLYFALSVLLGEGTANNLLEQITKEIDELQRERSLPS